eukprot:gene847-9096_t
MNSFQDKTDTNYDLPKANIQRIIKSAIPEGFSLVNDSKIAFSKSTVVFIMYLTAIANEHALKNKRSTIQAEDVLAAIDDLDLSDYKEDLLKTLNTYRKGQSVKKKKKEKKFDEKKDDKEEEKAPFSDMIELE